MADFHEDAANLTRVVVEPLLDVPEALEIEVSDAEDGAVLVEITVDESDAGKVIGRQGRTIKAIRTLVRAAGSRAGEPLVEVELVD